MLEALVVTVIGTIVGTVLAIEAKAWLPYLSCALVERTLRALPEALPNERSQRWSEEIRGDLHSYRDRPLGGLRFALALYRRGGRALASELALQDALAVPRVSGVKAQDREQEYLDGLFQLGSEAASSGRELDRLFGTLALSLLELHCDPQTSSNRDIERRKLLALLEEGADWMHPLRQNWWRMKEGENGLRDRLVELLRAVDEGRDRE